MAGELRRLCRGATERGLLCQLVFRRVGRGLAERPAEDPSRIRFRRSLAPERRRHGRHCGPGSAGRRTLAPAHGLAAGALLNVILRRSSTRTNPCSNTPAALARPTGTGSGLSRPFAIRAQEDAPVALGGVGTMRDGSARLGNGGCRQTLPPPNPYYDPIFASLMTLGRIAAQRRFLRRAARAARIACIRARRRSTQVESIRSSASSRSRSANKVEHQATDGRL